MDARKEIMEFISRKEKNGALLLSGKWGCGKTYLIRKIKDELNQESQYAVVIVSLFGIDSVQGIDRKVKEQVFGIMVGSREDDKVKAFTRKAKSAMSSATNILRDFSKVAKGLNTALSINPYDLVTLSDKIPCRQGGSIIKKELILVFDDLERSKIDQVDLLGVINGYSENIGIKTILIADEEHIDGEKYRAYKEKLISRTVRITVNYASAILEIISAYKETVEGYKNFLEKNIDRIALVFIESGTENIRSFKAFLLDFERIYQAWLNSGVSVDCMPEVLYSFGAMLFDNKNAERNENETKDPLRREDRVIKKYSEYSSQYILTWLEKWITTGEWNEEKVVDEIKNRFGVAVWTPDQMFLYSDFWDMTQEMISEGLALALQKAYEGRLCRGELMRLLNRTYLIQKYAIPVAEKINYGKLSQGIDCREMMMKNGEIIEDSSGTFITEDVLAEMPVEAREIYKRIDKLEERIVAWNNRRNFIAFIQKKHKRRHELKYNYLVSFDNELCTLFFEAYKNQENGHKRQLILALKDLVFDDRRVSAEDDVLETRNNLARLRELIQRLYESEQDAIAKISEEETLKVLKECERKLQN